MRELEDAILIGSLFGDVLLCRDTVLLAAGTGGCAVLLGYGSL